MRKLQKLFRFVPVLFAVYCIILIGGCQISRLVGSKQTILISHLELEAKITELESLDLPVERLAGGGFRLDLNIPSKLSYSPTSFTVVPNKSNGVDLTLNIQSRVWWPFYILFLISPMGVFDTARHHEEPVLEDLSLWLRSPKRSISDGGSEAWISKMYFYQLTRNARSHSLYGGNPAHPVTPDA